MTAVAPIAKPIIPQNALPVEKCFLMKVSEFALKVILPFAAIYALYAILPITFVAVHLPFIGATAAISYSFLFRSPEEVQAPLPLDAPRGIINRGANCWVNALTQTLRSDVGIKNWIEQSPEGIETRLSYAAFMDPSILFSAEDLELHPLETVPLISIFQIPELPANFAEASPQAQLNYRKACNAKILDWIFKTSEITYVSVSDIFSDSPVDDIIDGIENLPDGEQAGRLRNTRSLIQKIRQYALVHQMTEEEKLELTDSIKEFRSACFLMGQLNVVDHADILLGAEVPQVDLMVEFDGLMQANPIITLHHLGRKYPVVKKMIQTIQAVEHLSAAEKQNLLKYLSVIYSTESSKRLASMQFLANYKRFFADYERDRLASLRCTISPSQQLRIAFSQNSVDSLGRLQISQRIAEQCDPSEAIRFAEHILPHDLKGSVFVDGNLVSHSGFLSLPPFADNPSVQAMVDDNLDQFYQAPASLWPAIHRFKFERPSSFFHSILPCCFPQPEERSMKISSPIQLEEQVTIHTVLQGDVSYKLDSFIVHEGDSANSGHYIAYKLEQDPVGNSIWYELNDSNVRVVNGEILAQAKAQAYLPHYSRI